MQLEILGETHEKLLQKEFGLSLDEFKKLSYEQMDKMVDDTLMWIECEDDNPDRKTVSEIIDSIYGPYNDDDDEEEKTNDAETRTESCPCCGKENMVDGIGMYDICLNCGWEEGNGMTTKSIYETICESINEEGRLPEDFSLAEEEAAPNEIKFAPGALDGIGVFHANPQSAEKAVKKIVNLLKAGETNKIQAELEKSGVLPIIDQLLSTIEENNADFDLKKLAGYAHSLAFESSDKGLVKLGIALLGLFDWSDVPIVPQSLITLAAHDEFTLYVVIAAETWDNGNDAVFQIAQRVDGWGKIHAVSWLEPETKEIREWILRSGCKNAVMDAYLGLECAIKGDLIEALRRDALDAELYESIGTIIEALLDEGPVPGMSAYEHAEEALLRYLQFAEKYAATLKDLWHVLNVEMSIKGLGLSNEGELSRLCEEISGKPVWAGMVRAVLADPESDGLFYAVNVAGRLKIDISDSLYAVVKKDPIKYYGYISPLYKNPEYAKELTALYESVLPLDQIATGMGDHYYSTALGDEHFVLEFVLQELRKHPHLGETLVKAALGSPVVRERNGACAVLDEWGIKLGQTVGVFSPELYALLKKIASAEVHADTKKYMEEILNGVIAGDDR